jgi:hypothetical protein
MMPILLGYRNVIRRETWYESFGFMERRKVEQAKKTCWGKSQRRCKETKVKVALLITGEMIYRGNDGIGLATASLFFANRTKSAITGRKPKDVEYSRRGTLTRKRFVSLG